MGKNFLLFCDQHTVKTSYLSVPAFIMLSLNITTGHNVDSNCHFYPKGSSSACTNNQLKTLPVMIPCCFPPILNNELGICWRMPLSTSSEDSHYQRQMPYALQAAFNQNQDYWLREKSRNCWIPKITSVSPQFSPSNRHLYSNPAEMRLTNWATHTM